MKKIVFTAAVLCFTAFTGSVFAQNENEEKIIEKDKKESQEIIIRKKGDKDSKITVEIKGDKVTVNGKPLSEFKDDDITVNKRKVIIRDRNRMDFENFDLADGKYLEGLNFMREGKEGSSAFLGVTTGVFNDGSEETKPKGAQITDVSEGSAAAKAGLKNGDVIVKINDKPVTDPASLSDVVTSFKPKEEVTVYYTRDGKAGSATAVLGERKNSNAMAYSFSGPDGMTRSFTVPRIKTLPNMEYWNDKESGDMSPRVWTPGSGNNFEFFGNAFANKQKLGLKVQDTEDGNGVKVLEVDKDSPAEKAGLKKDDLLTEIGGKKVANTDDVREQLHDNADKSTYTIKATRNGSSLNFNIKIPKKLKTADL
ncbi:MAG: PDZ domain-containing protein [Ferruginibacter sp.]